MVVASWVLAVGALSVVAGPRWWQGPVVVALVLLTATVVTGHCVRRFGGVTGDVIGASIELTTTLTAVGLAIHP